MQVFAPHAAIGKFFLNSPMYKIPRYQRGYAWDESEVQDFLSDLENCFLKRESGNALNHFFGGIVCVKNVMPGAIDQSEFDLVDGQQRLATIVMLVGSLVEIYSQLKEEAASGGNDEIEQIIKDRIEKLKDRFIEFELEVGLVVSTYDVLTLSVADRNFFKDILLRTSPEPIRDSHRKIEYAFNAISQKVQELTQAPSIPDTLTKLEVIQLVIDNDISILRIETDTKDNAYRLFQVLNDRGKNLSEGDLLRAKTLEITEGRPTPQNDVEILWDDILADPPIQTVQYLRWIYASKQGKVAGKNTLFDDYLDAFYPNHHSLPVNVSGALEIKKETKYINNEVKLCRKIQAGEWVFSIKAPIRSWDRNRQSILIRELKHDLCMPLLLAAKKLKHNQYSEIIQLIELFMFRYIAVCKQHPTKLSTIYLKHSNLIRSDPSTYDISDLRADLHTLQTDRAPDALFEENLRGLSYKKGGGNKVLKYFLMTIEYYLKWFNAGSNGQPICIDKSCVYDFSDTTIEHIYPRNAHAPVLDSTLEQHKNTLGNLTFLSPTENVTGGNDDFSTKIPIFQSSSVLLNRELAVNNQDWDIAAVNNHAAKLINIGLKVFSV